MSGVSRRTDSGYFDWLYSLVAPTSNINPARTHYLLAEQLFKTDFVWLIPNDDNRMEDGKSLRTEFLEGYGYDQKWMDEECTIFELLIALSRRLSFEGGGDVDEWFWKLVSNLGLYEFTDERYSDWVTEQVTVVLDDFVNREYGHSGEGGLFPLQHTDIDQTEVELWYQMSYYLLEGNHVGGSA